MALNKPYSEACERNKEPILQVLKDVYKPAVTVVEIGSGTGQHACHFACQMPWLYWQPTDLPETIPGLTLGCGVSPMANLLPPLALDVANANWPISGIDALFTANTLHIMSWETVRMFFTQLGKLLHEDAAVCIYGPFNYHGSYTSDSNEAFDRWLKNRDPLSGIRDFEAVTGLAATNGLTVSQDITMPANNRLLIFKADGGQAG